MKMRKAVTKKTFALTVAIALTIAAGGTYFLRTQRPLDPDSPYMEQAHQVSEGSRPVKVADLYSYVLKDPDVTVRESRKCKRCHGDMLEKVDGEPKYPIHFAMINPETAPNAKTDEALLKLECVNCHKKVDLGRRSPEKVTIRVDRNKCTLCHELKQKERLGTTEKKEDPNAESIGTRNLMANHGVNHENGKAWLVKHREVAGVIGVVACRRCHGFDTELDICNECHYGWHGENWKGLHIGVAKKLGVKPCVQCHVPKSKMDICSKQCHGKSPLDV